MSTLTVPYMYDWVEVEFSYNKGFRGNREEPPEPEEVEIENVLYNGQNVNDIIDMELLEEKLWEVIDSNKRNYD